MNTFSRRWLVPVILILLAMVLRGTYLINAPKGMQFDHVDAQGYHWLAVNMLDHGVFSMNTEPPFRPDNVRAPLYPLFVASWYAIHGPNVELVVLVNVLLDVLTVVLLYRLGMEVAGRRAGWLAGLLYALNPASWRFTNELLTEILFGLLLTAAVWMFARVILRDRIHDAWRCGCLFGLAILCKPNVQFLPLVLILILAQRVSEGRKRWWQSALVVVGVISMMLLPWVVRNRIVFDDWFYTRTFDDNLAHVSAVSTLAEVRGERVAPWSARWEELYDEVILTTALRYDWQVKDQSEISARERDERLLQLKSVAREIVLAHPVSFVTVHTRAVLWSFVPQEHRFWYTQLTGDLWTDLPTEGDALGRALRDIGTGNVGRALQVLVEERIRALPPLALTLWLLWGAGYAMAGVLAVWGAWRLRPRVLSLFIAATIFYVTFVPGPISGTRFRLPVTPLILLLVVVGVMNLWARIGSGAAAGSLAGEDRTQAA
jgi:4-amino-4-deoxy-L-arabinose transferase-like glycosyltransferase